MGQTRTWIRQSRVGFTLIELLVVIAIIAVLVGILLPGLKKARDSGRMLKCQINVKQIVLAVQVYGRDYKDQVWPALDWADQGDVTTGFKPGLLFDYVDYADFIVECPTNKRGRGNLTSNGVPNGFGWNRDLNFDYTMLDETEGAILGTPIFAGYVPPSTGTGRQATPAQVTAMTMFPALPIFVEESTYVWNEIYTDGLWGNQDQVTLRHEEGGYIGYLDGQVGLFKQRQGRDETISESGLEFEANHVYVSVKRKPRTWFKVSDPAAPNRWGWINNPRAGS